MKRILCISLLISFCSLTVLAQVAGNRNYNQSNQRTPPTTGNVGNNNELFIEAYVLLNVAPDEFVAVFGVAAEAPTAVESNRKVNAQIEQFLTAAGGLGIKRADTFVDFITQNRVYDFSTTPSDATIREIHTGFETKKTVAVRYKDQALLERLVTTAAQAQIFDLIKVDYVVNDMTRVRSRLFEEAIRVVKQKEENYARQLGVVI
ncbi:MAG TPA: SIMPL domain-containing protein, partial [Pyrinomonadaceae bacterium]|nr:SIMPL domain-containing protein [Pyrinomonadaceae bacterium]